MTNDTPTWIRQGHDEIVIDAAQERIWSFLENSQRLPDWMPLVRQATGERETAGAVRTCQVNLGGRAGVVVERCVVCERPSRIGWQVVEDTLGFSKMLRHFTFDFVLDPVGPSRTRLINSSYFEPRTWLAELMVVLMIRKKFRNVRQMALANIKRLAEQGGNEPLLPTVAVSVLQ